MREIFFNGKVYTADGGKQATAFVVEGDKFLYVGSDEEAKAYAQAGDKVRDMEGARIVPGMFDTHCHFGMTSMLGFASWIPIYFELDHEEVLALIKEETEKYSIEERPIITGLGYGGVACNPLATELDKAVPDRPALLMDSSGHGAWINTKMMEYIGLDKDTPDPNPGASYFARDAEGNPTGHIVENDAEVYVMRKAGIASAEKIKAEFPGQVNLLHSLGIIGAYDAGFIMMPEDEVLEALSGLDQKIQYYTSFNFNRSCKAEGYAERATALREKYESSWLHPTTLKLFKDGTFDPETAYLFEDYLPPASGHGAEMFSTEEMLEVAGPMSDAGFNVHTHAVGDRAIWEVLDVYEGLGNIQGTKTICHVTLPREEGMQRFIKEGDVFYQTTPVWLIAEEGYKKILGKERFDKQMPLRTAADNGVPLVFGSDFPVSGGDAGVNPFINMWAALGRGKDDEFFVSPKSEALTAVQVLDAYSINAAKMFGAEDALGSITPGKQAHFVVIDRDVLNIGYEDIMETKVLETWYNGEVVYEA